jgi:hypothetical protein
MTTSPNNVTNPPACPKCDHSRGAMLGSAVFSVLSGGTIAALTVFWQLYGISLVGVIVVPAAGVLCVSSLVTLAGSTIYFFKHEHAKEDGPVAEAAEGPE